MRVLLVDDEPSFRRITKLYLEEHSEDFLCDTCGSVAEALELLGRGSYDVVVSDYEMPGKNGIVLLVAVRSRYPTMGFILFTGRGREEVAIEALNRGADHYLQKGFDPEAQFAELAHKIRRVVERKRVHESLTITRFSVEHAADAVFWVAPDGRLAYANKSACTMLGYTRDELLTLRIWDVDTGLRGKDGWAAAWKQLTKTGATTLVSSQRTRDGRLIPVEVSANHLQYGNTEYSCVTVRNISERVLVERSLKQSEETLWTFMNAIGQPTLLIDRDGLVLTANEMMCGLAGLPREKLLGTCIFDHLPAEVAGIRAAAFDRAVSGGEPVRHEDFCNGRYTDYRLFPVVREGGRVSCVAVVGIDVTDFKNMELALREQEERLRNVIEYLPFEVFVLDRSGTYVLENSSCRKHWGGIVGKRPEDVIEDRQYLLVKKEFYKRAFAGETLTQSFCYLWQGKQRHIHSIVIPIRESGEVTSILGVNVDITRFRKAEEDLQLREIAMASSLSAMAICGAEGRLTYINGTCADLWEYSSPQEMLGRPAASFWKNDERFHALTAALRETGAWSGELTGLRRDGSEFSALLSARRVRDKADRPLHTVATFTDISGHVMHEEALRQANQRLQLLSGVTRHDILNQVVVLKGYLSLLARKGAGDPVSGDLIGRLHEIAGTIERQISLTADYERMGSCPPAWQRVDGVIRAAASLISPADVTLSIGTGDLEVRADPMLEKAFYNILENAFRHGGRVSQVSVGFSEEENCGLLVVEDDGIGISADLKADIFEKGVGSHTGYGLFLAREILAVTGISIRETGEEGRGARFELLLPKETFRQRVERRAGTVPLQH